MKAPSELYSRADDVGAKPTREWLCHEARYVVEMIQQGGSDYNDSPDGGRVLLSECRTFIAANC